MGGSWSSACSSALKRELNDQLNVTQTFFGVLSGFMLLCSAVAGFNLFKFSGLSDADQSRAWNLYRSFTSLIIAGGLLGAVAWLCYMTSLSANFTAQQFFKQGPNYSLKTTQQFAETYLWLGIYFFFEPLTFGCLTVSKLMVLDRIYKFNSRTISDDVKSQFERFMTRSLRLVLFLNMVVVVAAWTSMGLWHRSYELQIDLASQYSNNVTNPDASAVQEMTARARRSAVAVYAAELVVLLVLALLFIFFGGLSIVRLSALGKTIREASVVTNSPTSSNSLIAHAYSLHRSLWMRVVSTVTSVFCSFIVRCVYNAMYVSAHQATIRPDCSNFGNCAECQDKLFIISNWFAVNCSLFVHAVPTNSYPHRRMDFTPEFAASITLVSEPLTMLIAVWAMTTHTKYSPARTGTKSSVGVHVGVEVP